MTTPLPLPRTAHQTARPDGGREGDLNRAVRDGLDGLDAGEFVDDDTVWAWVDSWDTDAELPMPEPRVASPRRS